MRRLRSSTARSAMPCASCSRRAVPATGPLRLALLGLLAATLTATAAAARAQPEPAGAAPAPAAPGGAEPDRPGPAGSTPAQGARDLAPPEWRQNYCCGVNCLYVLLRMLG